jgi:hypothetical protein
MYSEPSGPTDDAWNPPHLEYALSVGTRLSANAQDDMTFSATEIDGPIDWNSPASPRRKAYHVVGGGPEHDAAPHFKRFSLLGQIRILVIGLGDPVAAAVR